MKERPILFSAPMVRALLEGRKTQTRRAIKRPERLTRPRDCAFCCPYGEVGDVLWCRETFLSRANGEAALYRADYDDIEAAGIAGMYSEKGWTPSIFMPRKLSRIALKITDVQVQKLQAITEEDAEAEGVAVAALPQTNEQATYRRGFQRIWTQINGNWDENPWVWVIGFRRAAAKQAVLDAFDNKESE